MKIRSRKSLILTLIFLLLFSVPGFALDYLYPAKVERVIDGDTIVVDLYLGLGVVYVDGININTELMEKGHTEEYKK